MRHRRIRDAIDEWGIDGFEMRLMNEASTYQKSANLVENSLIFDFRFVNSMHPAISIDSKNVRNARDGCLPPAFNIDKSTEQRSRSSQNSGGADRFSFRILAHFQIYWFSNSDSDFRTCWILFRQVDRTAVEVQSAVARRVCSPFIRSIYEVAILIAAATLIILYNHVGGTVFTSRNLVAKTFWVGVFRRCLIHQPQWAWIWRIWRILKHFWNLRRELECFW